jgi:MFS family permease
VSIASENSAGARPFVPRSIQGQPIGLYLKRYILIILCVTGMLNALDRFILGVLLQPIKMDLGASDTEMGILTGGAFALLYFGAAIPLARLADRGVRRTILGITLLTWTTMTMLCGLAHSYWQLLLARMGVAVGEAGCMPVTYSLIPDIYAPEKRGSVIGILYFAQMIGIALSLSLGGFLNEQVGWRMTLIIIAIPGFVLALLILLTIPEPARRERIEKGSIRVALAEAWSIPSFRAILALAGGAAFCGYAILGWAPAFLIRVHGLTTTQVGQLMGFGLLVGSIGSLVGGRLIDRLSARNVGWTLGIPLLGLALSLPPALYFLHGPVGPLMVISYAIFQFLCAWVIPGAYTVAINLTHSHNRALSTSIVQMFQSIGGIALGTVVVGVLNDFWTPSLGEFAIRYSLTCVLAGSVLGIAAAIYGMATLSSDLLRVRSQPPEFPAPGATPVKI